MNDRLLTAAELGELLGLTAGTILDRFERGDLPGYRLFGRKGGPVRFREAEILEALDGWKVNRVFNHEAAEAAEGGTR